MCVGMWVSVSGVALQMSFVVGGLHTAFACLTSEHLTDRRASAKVGPEPPRRDRSEVRAFKLSEGCPSATARTSRIEALFLGFCRLISTSIAASYSDRPLRLQQPTTPPHASVSTPDSKCVLPRLSTAAASAAPSASTICQSPGDVVAIPLRLFHRSPSSRRGELPAHWVVNSLDVRLLTGL